MSFSRATSDKNNSISMTKPSLPTLPKGLPRLQSKRYVPSNKVQTETKAESSFTPSQEDLDDIVNNLSTIVKRSEQLLTPVKSSSQITTVRRTSSLHITNQQNLSNSFVKTSNSHHDQLTGSNLDLSRLSTQRRSMRNVEKFSGIKCSLPSSTSTIPTTFKGLDKHRTPTTNKTSSSTVNQITPTETNGKMKSPWRLRFEKFLNHQELTPLSPTDESIAFQSAKTSALNKENRTPSFRLPTRRTSKIHSVAKQSN